MIRMWAVYDKAKKEFFATNANSLRKQDTAKFLRDTAENILHHIRGKRVDQRLLDELKTTFEVAKHTAMTLHGGKKRKFDQPVPPALPEISGDDSNRSWRDSAQVRGRRSGPIDVARANAGPHKRPRTITAPTDHLAPSGQSCPYADYGRSGVNNNEMIRDRRRLFSPEISPKNRQASKHKKQQPGRGHSGIPYGYTRPVDSYYPA